jgi:hypothetical protein
MSVKIGRDDWRRIIENVMAAPDKSWSLRDLEREVAKTYGVDAKTARRLVREHDAGRLSGQNVGH